MAKAVAYPDIVPPVKQLTTSPFCQRYVGRPDLRYGSRQPTVTINTHSTDNFLNKRSSQTYRTLPNCLGKDLHS